MACKYRLYRLTLLIICSFLLSFTRAWAAPSDSLIFSGTLSIDGAATYKYKLVLAMSEGKWRGYSLLDEAGPDETKSTVSVQFSRSRKGMLLTERAVIATRSQEQSFCFIHAALKLSGKHLLKGVFLGRDKQQQNCGTGSMRLNVPAAAMTLMTPDGSTDTLPKVVTESISQSFRTASPEVYLELWDGGNVDQDSLSVRVNGVLVSEPFAITAERRRIAIRLQPGVNRLAIRALNEGVQPPNSARISLEDGIGRHTLISYLKSGQEAIITIHRK